MIDTLSPDLVEALLEDCRQNLTAINRELSDAQFTGTEVSADLVNRMFRSFHSLKGAAAYLRSHPLIKLSETSERVLSEIRDHGLVPSTPVVDALLASADRMDEIVRDFELRSDFQIAAELEKLACVLRATSSVEPNAGVGGGRIKCLVVEDDDSSRVLLQGLMAKYGPCHVASNGREAVTEFTAALQSGDPYRLVCIDSNLPGMGGKETVHQMKTIEKSAGQPASEVKIFMTTSIGDMRAVVAPVKILCDAFLFKPVNGVELYDHLLAFGLLEVSSPSEKVGSRS